MKVSTISEMRALDGKAIEQYGITAELLMENAGQAAYYVILKEFGVVGRRFVVLCGLGNNAGDGLVVARKLHSSGGLVRVLTLGDPGGFRGAAKANFEIVSRLSIEVRQPQSIRAIEDELAQCDAVVDAMLGTGITGDVRGLYRDAIEALNRSGKTVFSVDIPSGVDGDTGQVRGAAVWADYTVTFGLPKIGNALAPGYELCGKLYVSHISFPPSMTDASSLKIATNHPMRLSAGPEKDHSKDYGRALFILGAAHSAVAVHTVSSFLEAGGRRVQLAVPRCIARPIVAKETKVVVMPLDETVEGDIALENKDVLLDIAQETDVVGLGPGLSLGPETPQLVHELVGEIRKPLVIADIGTMMPQILRQREAETVVICDIAELAHIAGTTVSKVHDDPVGVLQSACGMLNATIVWMEERPLIGFPDGRVFINLSDHIRGGGGDWRRILLGTVAAMLRPELPLRNAARHAVFVHGLCLNLAASKMGEDRITAQALLDHLPQAVEIIREERLESGTTGFCLV